MRFHAAPPPGWWSNDPNGLIRVDGRWRLFAQCSATGTPDAIGWGSWSSDDLLRWNWDGLVIPPDDEGLAYSGCVRAGDGRLAAYLTRHRPGLQRQFRLRSVDGIGWVQEPEPLGPQGRNVRDPFVVDVAGERFMLLAEPCDWTDWEAERPSVLSVWRAGAGGWTRTGTIGPWQPRGVMWEVPALLDFGDAHVLLISTVDRRGGGKACSVLAWTGRFDGTGFAREHPEPQRVDQGDDFYAAIPAFAEPLLVGWASNWAEARERDWGGAHGGPISLPRRIAFDQRSRRLVQTPLAASLSLAHPVPATALGDTLRLAAGVEIAVGRDWLCWRGLWDGERRTPNTGGAVNWTAFWDSPLLELFASTGDVATIVLPGVGNPFDA